MSRPKVTITLIDQKGDCPCHRGHKIGDRFDFDTERGSLCPMAMHVAFPFVDILRYGGTLPGQPEGRAVFCCPDPDTINVFSAEIEKGEFGEEG
ncbi:MAG: TIGR04076 family protein [Oscillospiraceae bacterium]|nr:TIGR04076 family protein [Oscillospiraceae bacterium]